ncbi:sigma-70 family RNA polymerase sigma factor [Chloroflexus sp.]|uniref:sigma-70 family RNA polymerase sigma factor n=1 Tax=Chloroflexus sp. TaxID=1904827 RepID=UPI0026313C41|nr:sigma-70 family RNA polymerase sigma factor [uncultured Chloroflexus sp.]
MANEEQRLISAAQAGDLDAFNQIVRLYETRVYNLCYRMLGDVDTAADTTQEVFIAAFRNIRNFRGGLLKSWLLRIATNACYDVLRARQRRPSVSLNSSDDEDEGGRTDVADPGESLDDVVIRQELSAAIQHGLAALPEDQRIVIVLSDIQGLTYEEIAQITGVQLGTVKSRLSRARAKLRDILRAGELLPLKFRLDDESNTAR